MAARAGLFLQTPCGTVLAPSQNELRGLQLALLICLFSCHTAKKKEEEDDDMKELENWAGTFN